MKFGVVPSNQDYPFDEKWYHASPAKAVASNGSAPAAVGTYIMPFAGTLVFDMIARCTWTGDQWVAVNLSASSPVPNVYSDNYAWDGLPAGYGTTFEIPVSGRWTSLAANQTVTLSVNVTVGGTAPTVTLVAIGGTVRAFQ
jgi:hypothetical protein